MLDSINLKYVVLLFGFLCYSVACLVVLKLFFKYPKFREYLLQSIRSEVTGKVSGKSLTAVFFVHIIGFSAVMAVVYSKDHLLPAYFLDALLLFIAALYGINKIPTKGGAVFNSEVNTELADSSSAAGNQSHEKNKRKVIDNPDA